MKIYAAVISALTALSITASASAEVLGTATGSYAVEFGAGTYLHKTSFMSEQTGVGEQTEYYVEYEPNTDAVPVVENGMSVWGTRTIEDAARYIENRGYRPLIGINGDYFSFTTGIPMGTAISRGEILTKNDGTLDAVGFREDGTGFIGELNIKTTLSDGSSAVNVECINKWYTSDYTPICLLTDKFAASTHTLSECLFLICSVEDGRTALGETLRLRVDEKFEYDGNIDIPSGKAALLISKYGTPELYSFLNNISVGQELTVTNEAVGDGSDWENAENAIGTSAGRLISGGRIGGGFEEGSAPRTAVGIKPDGKIIFYVLDGRQSGYSYGARVQTIARRLLELGCVEAINLDGGGSSAMAGVYPGSGTLSIINSPSDGYLRSCANYIFLQDTRRPTGIVKSLNFTDDANKNYISGTSVKITYDNIYDTSDYPMDSLDGAKLEVENDGESEAYIDNGGVLHFEGGNGTAAVYVVNSDGSRVRGAVYGVFDTPDSIKIYDESSWTEISEIYLKPSRSFSVSLSAAPYIGSQELHSWDGAFEWEIQGDIGTIDKEGNYTAKTTGDKAGKILVRAGSRVKEINVFVSGYNGESEAPFADISGHWAQKEIVYMAESGIVNGIELDGKTYFKPDNFMTRAEFAQICAKFMGIRLEEYSSKPLVFADKDEIAPWAQNAAKAMYEKGIITGRTGDNGVVFAPEARITRAEAMTILGRLIDGKKTKPLDFADTNDVPQWARTSMEKLYARGIIQGYSDNTVLPNNSVKRAEAVTLLYKIGERS